MNINEEIINNDIEIIKCKEIHDCFVFNNNYKDLINKKLSLKDLNNYPLILQSKKSNTRLFLDNLTNKYNLKLNPNIELSSYTLVVEFAKIGLGIGYVTEEYIKNELQNNTLYKLDIKEEIPSRYIGIATSKNNLPNFSTKKLIEIIKNKNLS